MGIKDLTVFLKEFAPQCITKGNLSYITNKSELLIVERTELFVDKSSGKINPICFIVWPQINIHPMQFQKYRQIQRAVKYSSHQLQKNLLK